MEIIFVLFWANALLGIGQAVVLAVGLCRRSLRHWTAALAGGSLVLSAAGCAWLWRLEGPCLLPHPSVVEFRAGMTLCPGQSVRLPPIELNIPRPGRDL